MWITARLIITIASFFYRLFLRTTPQSFPMSHNGVPYSATVSRSWRSSSCSVVETPVHSCFICSLSAESTLDRWAKAIGFGDEIQIPDADFNKRIFILGDHPLTAEYLCSSEELRNRICALIPQQVKSISITGETLRLVAQRGYAASSLLEDLVFMKAHIEEIQHRAKSRFSDPFYTRAVLLESLILAVLTYGWVSFTEMRVFDNYYHVRDMSLVKAGLGASLTVAITVVALTWALLGKSSRGIRLMIENGLLIMIALPVVGYEIISDLNRGLDDSESIIVTSEVVDKYKQSSRSSRGYYSTTYYLKIIPKTTTAPLPFKMPKYLSVTADLYGSVKEGERIDCEIGLGYLGFPWYRSIQPHYNE